MSSDIMGEYIMYYHAVVCLSICTYADIKIDQILISKMMEIAYQTKPIQQFTTEYLQKVYDCVKDWKIYEVARDTFVKKGLEIAIDYLRSHREEVIEFLRRNKNIVTPLTILPTAVITKRAVATVGPKAAIRFGAKASSRGVKTLTKMGNPASLAVDVVQTGLEITGHTKAGMAVGGFGNIGVGAATGFMIGGPPGAAVGVAVCFGSWVFSEIVGATVYKALS